MSKGLAFWILMIIWAIFGVWSFWPSQQPPALGVGRAFVLVLFALLFLLGWQIFGFVVQ